KAVRGHALNRTRVAEPAHPAPRRGYQSLRNAEPFWQSCNPGSDRRPIARRPIGKHVPVPGDDPDQLRVDGAVADAFGVPSAALGTRQNIALNRVAGGRIHDGPARTPEAG